MSINWLFQRYSKKKNKEREKLQCMMRMTSGNNSHLDDRLQSCVQWVNADTLPVGMVSALVLAQHTEYYYQY